MIQTLRITSVAVAILAGVVIASIAGPASLLGFGVKGDEQMEKILNAPSAVDRFKEQHGDKPQTNQDTTPPLIRQAELLANIINPPASTAPAVRTATKTGTGTPPPPPPRTSAVFGLVGTSYSPNPNESFAYIRLADNSYMWIRPGEAVGHLVVKQIRNGSILYSDGSRDVEMMVELAPETASLLEAGAASTPVVSESRGPSAARTPGYPVEATLSSISARPVTRAPLPSPRLTEEDQQALGDLVERLKQLDTDPATRAKLIAELKSSRVSPEEAEKLEGMGEELNENQDALRDARRREFLRRLSAPRPTRDE